MTLPIDNIDFLQELLDAPEEKNTRTRKPKDIRDQDTWYKLNHNVLGTCSQGSECLGLVLHDKGPGRVTAVVNDVEMCRFDFLNGLAKSND
jgi:hypothetical protein